MSFIRNKNWFIFSFTFTSFLLTGCDSFFSQDQTNMQNGSPLPAKVFNVAQTEIKQINELPGRVNSYKVAEVRPQVEGIVEKRFFKEGSQVEKGDLLYQIDPSTYQATLNNAKAELKKAQADEAVARKTAKRYKKLTERHVMSQQDFDDANSDWLQAKAEVEVTQAMVESAQIDLEHTKILAPISGRIGISEITEGALVTSGQSSYLTTIQKIDPVYIDMMQDTSEMPAQDIEDQAVEVKFKNGQIYAHQGHISFSDISVDTTTGSQTIRAVIPNPDKQLLPGMYIKGIFEDKQAQQVLLVPQSAVQMNSQGKPFVYMLDDKNQAKEAMLELGEQYKQYWIVFSGVKAGDKIVNSNLLKIKPSMQIKPIKQNQTKNMGQKAQEEQAPKKVKG